MLEELIDDVRRWGKEKGILSSGNPVAQSKKFLEEAGEVMLAVGADNDLEIMDGIGDTLVTLIMLSELKEMTLYECLLSAYNEIKDRKGQMVDGTFVKEIG